MPSIWLISMFWVTKISCLGYNSNVTYILYQIAVFSRAKMDTPDLIEYEQYEATLSNQLLATKIHHNHNTTVDFQHDFSHAVPPPPYTHTDIIFQYFILLINIYNMWNCWTYLISKICLTKKKIFLNTEKTSYKRKVQWERLFQVHGVCNVFYSGKFLQRFSKNLVTLQKFCARYITRLCLLFMCESETKNTVCNFSQLSNKNQKKKWRYFCSGWDFDRIFEQCKPQSTRLRLLGKINESFGEVSSKKGNLKSFNKFSANLDMIRIRAGR